MPTSYFASPFFKFLTELTANNDRTWFNSNKTRYIHDVQEPALQFISDFAPRLKKISPHYVADPRPMGGSMFRIYRHPFLEGQDPVQGIRRDCLSPAGH